MERLGREVRVLQKPRKTEVTAVRCDICNEEFANSVELEKHMEREHPMGDGDEKLEKPDNMREEIQQAPVAPGSNQ